MDLEISDGFIAGIWVFCLIMMFQLKGIILILEDILLTLQNL